MSSEPPTPPPPPSDESYPVLHSINATGLLIAGILLIYLGDDNTVLETFAETSGGLLIAFAVFCKAFCFLWALSYLFSGAFRASRSRRNRR